MIRKLRLQGFKSFVDRTISLNQLTLLTGLNSSGKSTVIQALRMFEKAAHGEENILLDGHGTMDEIRNKGVRDAFSLQLHDENNSVLLTLNSENPDRQYTIEKEGNLLFPEIIYISASRFGPRTSIPIYSSGRMQKRIGENGENLLQCIEKFADEPLHESLRHEKSEGLTLLYNLRGWLNVISPGIEFDSAVSQLSDSSYSTFNSHRSANVGFGLSYTLPVITALLLGTIIPDSLVIIENPEAHVHPRGQTEIARLAALCAEAGAQIIIETHSDHLFDGVRIAAKNMKMADKIQLHWFELNENRNTEVYSPLLDNEGRVDEWPEGFFDQFEINASRLI